MELVTTSPKIEERIYIGGLNPPRLSGRDILRRLKSLDQIEIESASIVDKGNDEDDGNDDDNRPYVHITAISKHDSDSALSIIHKQYHNVKWKGCKLVVEVAKPHFLERLEQERRQRGSKAMATATKTATDTAENLVPNTSEAPSRIPRRLRVRKKHGDPAVHVDTKPWTVETWSRFDKARTKLKKQEEKRHTNVVVNNKHSNDESFSSSAPLMHRAVHIRFMTEDNNSAYHTDKFILSGIKNNIGGMMISNSGSLSVSSSSDSESESSDEGIVNKDRESSKKLTYERYEWSDDDSDRQNLKEINDGNAQEKNALTADIFLNQELNKVSNDIVKQQHNNEIYQWRKDKELSHTDDQQLTPAEFSGADEFVAGFEDTSSTFRYNENTHELGDQENSDCFNQGKNDNKESDLVSDVATNLNILSSIFPDMANARPMNPDSEDSSNLDNENITSSSYAKKSNSNLVHGIMPRYDPSAKSSRKYVLEDEYSKQNEEVISTKYLSSEEKSDDDVMDEDELGKIDNKKTRSETIKKSPPVSSIYEQDKLENVFRDARDAWGVEDALITMPSTTTTNTNPDKSSGKNAFNFGFKLNDNVSGNLNNQKMIESDPVKETFSFSFNVTNQDQGDVKRITVINDTQNDCKYMQAGALSPSTKDSKVGDDDSAGKNTVDDVATRHKGLTLPDQDLQKYVNNFFGCNNGIRIMQNPQEFMNDDKERAAWNSERQTLTLDWKRKRKYAITRIQKRMKVRRR